MRTDVDYRKDEYITIFSQKFLFHDDLSELAQETYPSEYELSEESERLLYRYALSFWLEDILNRENDVNEQLYDKAKELHFAYYFQVENHPSVLDIFVALQEEDGHVYNNQEDEQKIVQSQAFDFRTKVQDYYIDQLVQELLILIVSTGYIPDRETMSIYLQDPDKSDIPYGDQPDLDERLENHMNIYLLMLLLYPADNLSDYLHDQLVYRMITSNQKETISSYCRDIVNNRLLLNNTFDKNVYTYAISKCTSFFNA